MTNASQPPPISLIVTSVNGDTSARVREPITVGVPFPRGALTDQGLTLVNERDQAQLLQWLVQDRWPDGSVRWALLDWQADRAEGAAEVRYQIQAGASASARLDSPLTVSSQQGEVTVDTGAARFRLRAGGNFPFEEVIIEGRVAIDPEATGIQVTAAGGGRCRLTVARVVVEEAGPIRVALRVDASAMASGGDGPLVNVSVRLGFSLASPTVRCDLSVHNPRRASHPGGLWELGDYGSVFLQDVSFVVALPPDVARVAVGCSPEPGAVSEVGPGDVELFQASSGGDQWDSPTHVTRTGTVPLAFRGYRLRGLGGERRGQRATPIVSVLGAGQAISMTMPQFWENFPKTIAARGRHLVLGLFPREHVEAHEIQGGERKTHVFYVAFGHDGISAVPLDWARGPLVAHATPAHYCGSGAVPYLLPAEVDPHAAYLRLVDAAVDGPDHFLIKRERVDEYGWRNFGDLYADHEAVGHLGERPIVSHYNNQYDAIAGFAFQFMRTGDLRWWPLFTDLAAHVTDIDIYHTDRDKSAYNGGLFWHTVHYLDAGTSTHRSYPRAPQVSGGGPSAEHNYSTGLLLHHFLTGDPRSRQAAIDLADWVVDMDDGALTVFRWLARGDTGLASATAQHQVPGRGAGNSISVLLNGLRLTGDRRFLRKAEALIRRIAHPDDDVEGRDLLNAEQRWSYTVFLHALGRYLDDKSEIGEVDAMYAYARDTLLTYTRWMAVRERPFLDEPEKLEYPTETWAAQELWKSEVFDCAARHAPPNDRPQLIERAEFYFRYATVTLAGMPTRTVTRAVVLLLSHGWMRAYCVREPAPVPALAPPHAINRARAFVPQKEVAMRRLRLAAVGSAVAAAALVLWLLV